MARLIELLWESHANDDYPRYWPADAARFVISPGETGAWVAEQDGMVVGHVALHKASGDPTYEIAHRVTAIASAWTQCTFSVRQPYPWYRTVFSIAAEAMTMVAAGFAYVSLGGAAGPLDFNTLPKPLVGAIATYFFANTALVAGAIALYEAAGWTRLDGFRLEVRQGSLNLWVYLGPPP